MPDIAQLLKGIIRAQDVEFTEPRLWMGVYEFEAWTNPDEKYHVVFDPHQEGGWCKHTAACATWFAGEWMLELFKFVAESFPNLLKETKRGKQSSVSNGTDTSARPLPPF